MSCLSLLGSILEKDVKEEFIDNEFILQIPLLFNA